MIPIHSFVRNFLSMGSGFKLCSLLVASLIVARLGQFVHGEPQVPCYFIFGDSLVDAGNNNNLQTTAKVDYPPYGIDFPKGPTGRFCNGRTTADVIGELLGFDDFIPSFLAANDGSEILQGVNYASGSAGIRDETGKHLGVNIDLNQQLRNHRVIISRLADILGCCDSATEYLNKCFYSLVVGSNDYINNYFVPQIYNTSNHYTPEQYAQVLIEQYNQQIMELYNFGARKVALTGIGPVGCSPAAIATYHPTSLCVDFMNDAVNYFNKGLKSLVDKLNEDLPDAKFIYLNTYGIVSENTPSPDIKLKLEGCCKVNEYGLCIPGEQPCRHRNLHLFWDAFHPSEIANKISGGVSYIDLKKIL